MAKTKYTPPAGANKRLFPHQGLLYQQPLRLLYDDTDLDSFPLRARADLIEDVLPKWRIEWRRRLVLNGLYRRIDKNFDLRPGFEGVRKREVMGARDAARVRKVRKLAGAKGAERVGSGRPPVLGEGGKRIGVLVGGEGDRKWVLGEGARRALGLGIGESAAGPSVGVGRMEKTERLEKAARVLQKETEFWGGYKAVRFGL
ncbi:hypothetical protein K505DRAFT_324824 [Melanomma pulvis-pyrius CBS 109.77]|uniref:Uncharacterized protein n=1 Tax=Melanomma pulvis-pyrius CBS 109.77 TaxID=1314802 RepID=A0A6A6XCS4_9PLEO|nr:hypothetical protein K505DRAFT_324824 [Melanomma pulvis-pyrius CBS 109.77]